MVYPVQVDKCLLSLELARHVASVRNIIPYEYNIEYSMIHYNTMGQWDI